jgi:hypothetical protein
MVMGTAFGSLVNGTAHMHAYALAPLGEPAKVRPRARITRITVLNSGLPVSPSALYRLLSLFKSADLVGCGTDN